MNINFFQKNTIIKVVKILLIIGIISFSNISSLSIPIIIVKIILLLSITLIFYKDQFLSSIRDYLTNFQIYIIILLWASFTLLYSYNIEYGFTKALNFSSNIFILILLRNYFVNDLVSDRIEIFFTISIIITFSLILVLVLDPFDQSRIYNFELGRWSHVIFSRTMSLLYFYILLIFLYTKTPKFLPWLSLLLLIALYQIYLANLRAASLGVIIFSIVILSYGLYSQKLNKRKIGYLVSVFALLIALVYISPASEYFTDRYVQSFDVLTDSNTAKGGIKTRFDAYEKALDIIKDNTVLGIGLGGFNNYNEDTLLKTLRYPHNIFLEFQVELGIIGSIIFMVFIGVSINRLRKINYYFLIGWGFTIWLALFAKDISSNLLVFLPIIFYGSPYEREKLKEFLEPKYIGRVLPAKSSSISE